MIDNKIDILANTVNQSGTQNLLTEQLMTLTVRVLKELVNL
jgi:hypothetical protein